MKKSKQKEVRFITAPLDVYAYLTPRKKYKVEEVISKTQVKILDDEGSLLLTSILGSAHSKTKRNFIPSYS